MPLKRLKKSNIFCLEGDWNENLKHKSSILPALELLELNNSIQTIYKTCATKEEFNNRIYKLLGNETKYKSFDIIYLAFHGSTNKINLEDGSYTLDEISEEFENCFTNRIIHFGSCKTLAINKDKADRFLKKTNALAISGYQSNVKFISSTVFDVLYFEICQQYKDMDSIKTKMEKHYNGLIKELKFELFINKK